jgi:hypothetical protein
MMMECPRCGFAQPKDRYCASCGLDVDNYVAKPKPFLIRLAQNPDFHLSLIVILILLVVAYIFYAQRDQFGRQVGALISGHPLSSRDSRTSEPQAEKKVAVRPSPVAPPSGTPSPPPAGVSGNENVTAAAQEPIAGEKPSEAQKLDVSHWEVPHEALSSVLSGAEKVSESNAGRAFLVAQGGKALEIIQAGKRLAFSRSMPLQTGAQLNLETAPTANESFQFGLYFQNLKNEGKDVTIKFDSTLVLPTSEPGTDANAQTPSVKGINEISLRGRTALGPQGVLIILYEPGVRSVREEFLNKAGDGPWHVFDSEDFRNGISEWVVLVQLK